VSDRDAAEPESSDPGETLDEDEQATPADPGPREHAGYAGGSVADAIREARRG